MERDGAKDLVWITHTNPPEEGELVRITNGHVTRVAVVSSVVYDERNGSEYWEITAQPILRKFENMIHRPL